jgi:DNA-directed RNA polymerase specialized sigma24 family protein
MKTAVSIPEMLTERIKRYCLMGLTYGEIGKLLDISSRTVQRYVSRANLKKEIAAPKSLQQKAFELSAQGLSYSEIADKLSVTKTTVYLWHRKQKQASTPES